MLQFLKFSKLSGALKSQGPPQAAYAAVLELGRIGTPKAVDLLIESLSRRDGVSRSAARELGRLGDGRAIKPLAACLGEPEVCQSAAEALVKLGAVDALVAALADEQPGVRKLAATTLGQMGKAQALDALVRTVQTDPEYSVRTAAAAALGQLKDARAVWVLVGTLKLRDETTPERQFELEQLRQATSLALRKIGDPLATKQGVEKTAELVPEKPAGETSEPEVHPRLGDLTALSEAELVGVLKEVIASSEEISWANLENREPLLPPYFRSYEQRRLAAETIGAELYKRGGKPMLKRILEQDLAGNGAVSNWWAGMAEATGAGTIG